MLSEPPCPFYFAGSPLSESSCLCPKGVVHSTAPSIHPSHFVAALAPALQGLAAFPDPAVPRPQRRRAPIRRAARSPSQLASSNGNLPPTPRVAAGPAPPPPRCILSPPAPPVSGATAAAAAAADCALSTRGLPAARRRRPGPSAERAARSADAVGLPTADGAAPATVPCGPASMGRRRAAGARDVAGGALGFLRTQGCERPAQRWHPA